MRDRLILQRSDVAILRNGAAPLYHSLGQVIRGRIQSGEWPVGGRIPSERELMRCFGVSRATVRQSIDYLAKEGILQRRRGAGTFVAPPKTRRGLLRLCEFTSILTRSGSTIMARVLAKATVDPPRNVQQELGLYAGEPAIWLQRLWLADDVPMLIETLHLSAERFPRVLTDFQVAQSLEEFLREHYGVSVIRENEVFEPVILETAEAHLLGVKSGAPALWIESVAFSADGQSVLMRSGLLRGDRCRFYIDRSLA